ncbi:MAG: oligoendopeptidase F [Chlamydiales bacterium]|nr:oligoendopeptidase F [Chlamydiales bacterium]
MSIATEIKKRADVSPEDTWNAEALFKAPNMWDADFKKLDWSAFTAYRGRLHEGADILKEALEALLKASRDIERLHTYAHMRHDEDITNDTFKTAYQKIMARYAEFSQECAWFDPEVLSLPKEQIEQYIQDPKLAPYRFYLEKIVRLRPHTLSADKEELLALTAQSRKAVSNAFSSLNNADLKFNKVKDESQKEHDLTHGLYQLYLRSPDRTLRKNAFCELHSKFRGMENTLCDLLSGQVHNHIFSAKARKFPSALQSALFDKNIPTTVYESLISTVRKNLPSLHRYVKLRKKLLGVDELHLYDMYVPMAPDVDMHLSYEEAENVVIESVAPLGSEYQQTLQKGLKQDRWVDRYENENKRSGAYSTGCFDSFPYILMNYRGILRDVFTLAHEAGHSMHSYLSHKNQPYQDSHYPIFVAEVASTFNEELLSHLMLQRVKKKEERFFLINEKIEDLRATFFRQTMFAEFELQIHKWTEEGTPLTPKLLKEYYHKLNQDYFGPDCVIDEEISIEWARIPHFYYNFYVYQYATGISAALALCEKVLADDETARKNYLSFLQGGGSLFPIDLLKLAGIDMNSSAPVEAAVRRFDSLLDELEKLI